MRWVSASRMDWRGAVSRPSCISAHSPHERHQYGKGIMLRVPFVSQDTVHGKTRGDGGHGVGISSNTPHATPQTW